MPALQNSQKDTARRQAVGQALAALQNYESDNGGVLTPLAPTVNTVYQTATNAMPNYLGKLPANLSYLSHTFFAPVFPGNNDLEIVYGAMCGTDTSSSATVATLFGGTATTPTATKTVDHTTDAAVAVKLSSGSYYCKDI